MIWKSIIYGHNYAAIEHAEDAVFHLLQLRKQKEEFIILNRSFQNDFEQVKVSLKKQSHVFVVFNNEQVLTKKIMETHQDEMSLLRSAFPNIALSDFYYETYQTQEDSFIAIARKKYIDDAILAYQKKGISVIDFSLGNLAVKNIQEIVTEKRLQTSNAMILFEGSIIQEIKKEQHPQKKYVVNDLEVSNNEILALGGIISYYTRNVSSQIQQKLKDLYLQKRIFEVGFKSGLGFLLSVLFVNFLFFSSYRNQVNQLNGALEMSEQYKTQLNSLQKKVLQKKQWVQSLHSASNSKLSLYVDEIGKTTPATILLNQISFQPLNGVQRPEKALAFEKNKILIKGACKKNEDFSSWISLLEKKKWVQDVSINNYGKGKKRGTLSNFEFEITIDE